MSRTKLGDRHHRQDAFYRRAKKEQFAGRAVYKLQEIDQKYHLFRPGMAVLDLGCWPGSWLQYASTKIGPQGHLVGVDRFEGSIDLPRCRWLVGNVFDVTAAQLCSDLQGFHVVLSDMAPDTSGIRSQDQARSEQLFERALDIAEAVLLPGGIFVGKLFQGPGWAALLTRMRRMFARVESCKPQGSRKESIEQYIVGTDKSS